eukprot:TRINITY_DN1549_c0_g1_i1.p1 TRINITY_DN1549_c0_g1~~TRINITY_DN1549_c0_g1_i1.p1  ORF type:complete len:318 (+),score=56.20 TRINITY_DN1549_c0_g1_i1:64-954(+)
MDCATVGRASFSPFYNCCNLRRCSYQLNSHSALSFYIFRLQRSLSAFSSRKSRSPWLCRASESKEAEIIFPPQYYDDEWQAKQREKRKEFKKQQRKEGAEEWEKARVLQELGYRFSGYPETSVKRAKHLVACFIKAGEGVEEDERDAIQALDLLYRRVETEILKRTASPAMQLLNDLLNLYDGTDEYDWLQQCKELMLDVFPCEDPFTLIVPQETNLSKNSKVTTELPPEEEEILFRADFVRETDALLHEIKIHERSSSLMGFDPQSVALSLKLQQKERTVQQVRALRDLAISLKW